MIWRPSCLWTIQTGHHSKTGHMRITDPHCTVGIRIPDFYKSRMQSEILYFSQNSNTVGTRIPNAFGIRMVHSRSVQAPTIRIPNYG